MKIGLFSTVVAKKILALITVSLFFVACATNQNTVTNHNENMQNAHKLHLKKRKHRFKKRKQKIDLAKFCFKDNSSIHYRAEERCK